MTATGPEVPDDNNREDRHGQSANRRWPWIGGVVGAFGLGLVLGLVVSPTEAGSAAEEGPAGVESADDEPSPTRLEAAKQGCVPPPDAPFVEILDNGAGMSIDGIGAKKPQGASLNQIECILDELGAPSTVRARMGN